MTHNPKPSIYSKDMDPKGWVMRYKVYCDVLRTKNSSEYEDPRISFAKYWESKQKYMYEEGMLKAWQIEKLRAVGVV